MKKIKYVQLEPSAVLLDFLSSRMTTEQFGCYWLIMMQLYCNRGKCQLDMNELKISCNCGGNFEQIWEKIESKFQKKDGFIRHKRVTKELRSARKFMQHQRAAGLRGAQKRWAGHGDPNSRGIAKERKGKVSKEKQSKDVGAGGILASDDSFGLMVSNCMDKLKKEGVFE